MVSSCEDRETQQTQQRDPVQLVMQNADLVGRVLKFSARLYSRKAEASQMLRQAALVCGVSHEAAAGVLYRCMSIQDYCQIDPAMAPDEATAKFFAFYQSHTREITLHPENMMQSLSFLLNRGDSIHYIHCSIRDRPDVNFNVTIDLRKRIIHTSTRAILDRSFRVYVQAVRHPWKNGWKASFGPVERWPRGYQVVRDLKLRSFTKTRVDIKMTKLADILQSMAQSTPTYDGNDRKDEYRIVKLTILEPDDLLWVEQLYSSVDNAAVIGDISTDDIIRVLRGATVKRLEIKLIDGHPSPPPWSAQRLHQVLHAFPASQIETPLVNIVMTSESVVEFEQMSPFEDKDKPKDDQENAIALRCFRTVDWHWSVLEVMLDGKFPQYQVLSMGQKAREGQRSVKVNIRED